MLFNCNLANPVRVSELTIQYILLRAVNRKRALNVNGILTWKCGLFRRQGNYGNFVQFFVSTTPHLTRWMTFQFDQDGGNTSRNNDVRSVPKLTRFSNQRKGRKVPRVRTIKVNDQIVRQVIRSVNSFVERDIPDFFIEADHTNRNVRPRATFNPVTFLRRLTRKLRDINPVHSYVDHQIEGYFF